MTANEAMTELQLALLADTEDQVLIISKTGSHVYIVESGAVNWQHSIGDIMLRHFAPAVYALKTRTMQAES